MKAKDHPHILIAEDSQDDRVIMERALESAAQQCTFSYAFVANGLEAQKYLRGTDSYSDRSLHPSPDVVITDIKMPYCDGLELLAWVRKHDRAMPVAVLSASAEPNDVERAYGLGANTYFVKPARFAHLATWAGNFAEYWCRFATLPRNR